MTRGLTLLLVVFGVACGDAGAVVRIESATTGEALLVADADRAVTADERMRGLRGRAALAAGEGLLIEIPIATEVCIVNDGVAFAIDAIYASEAGEVIAIEREIAAGDGTPRCVAETRRVLEVSAGAASSVRVGDRMVVE